MAKINIDQFAILTDIVPYGDLSFTVSVGFKVAFNVKRIACEFGVTFSNTDGNREEKKILLLEETCEFDIHPEDWDILIENSRLTVSPQDLCLLANQAVGVARGVLYCKTENTPFTQFILPPINLTTLIKDNLIVDIEPSAVDVK